ncbi:MAG: hypothetical protein V7641_4102 [Blastocatellia bacterium]
MNKRLLLAIAFALIGLNWQTAIAQQSPARPSHAPQLTSDDLLPAANPSPAPVADEARPTASASKNWSRHAFVDLGVSIEFSGKPPAPMTYPKPFPENNLFDSQTKAQGFRGNGWILIVTRLSAFAKPTRDNLVNFAGGLVNRLSVDAQEYLPEPGPEPNFRIRGTRNKSDGQWGFSVRFVTQGKRVWLVMTECRQTDEQACAEALHILDSVRISL